MRTVTPVVFLLIWLYVVVAACSKDSTPNATTNVPPASSGETPPPTLPPSAGKAPYSGVWSGIVTVKDVNPDRCSFRDKTLEVTQAWTVLGDSVQVEEIIAIDRERKTYYWRGTIRNDTLSIISKRNELCNAGLQLHQIALKALFTTSADSYTAQGYTIYSICDPNCAFEFSYKISKTK